MCDAPSTLADSSSSIGTVSKKPFISHVFTPSAPPMYSRIRLHEVLKPIGGYSSEIVVNMM